MEKILVNVSTATTMDFYSPLHGLDPTWDRSYEEAQASKFGQLRRGESTQIN